MTIEFIGYIGNRNGSETIPYSGPVIDREHIRAAASIHENGGFDRVLLAFHSHSPESLLVGQYAASVTERLGFLLAHRPGFVAPTLAARQLATLDHLTGGRVAVHIITGAADAEMARDGDWLTKDERYARASEYIDILRLQWQAEAPFDYDGAYYRVAGARSEVRPRNLPVFFGGSSAAALAVAGRHADTYALWGETLEQVAETIAAVRSAAAPHGRQPRFSLSLRPILADTEQAAWDKADRLLARATALREAEGPTRHVATGGSATPPNEGSRRLLAAADKGARLDKRLWTGMAKLTGAAGNSTSLVGTADQVAEAMLDYHRIGIDTFLIRGFDPLEDAFLYGRDLIPRVRELAGESARIAAE